MKKLNLTKKAPILFAVMIAMLSLVVAPPEALAHWQEGPGIDWWYIDASYVDYHDSGPLVIEINGDPTDSQIFSVGQTITITVDLHAVAQSCAGDGNGAYTEWHLDVTGTSGPDSVSSFNYDHNSGCAVADEDTTLTIEYGPLTAGAHSAYASSYAAVSQYWEDVAEDFVEDLLNFEVIDPGTSVGDCISTRIDSECDGLKGPERADCNKVQIGICHYLYGVPSAHNE